MTGTRDRRRRGGSYYRLTGGNVASTLHHSEVPSPAGSPASPLHHGELRIGGAPFADVRRALAMEYDDGNMILIAISYSLQWK